MRIWLDLLDDFVEQLAEKGQDLSKAALEALAIDAYRMNRISGYQLGQLLEIPSRYELDGVLIQIWSNDPRARCPPIRRRSDANSAEALGDSSGRARLVPRSGRSDKENSPLSATWRPE
jgi:hypothetical protein